MALSGNSLHWFRSTYHGIYITWSATQSYALNQSYVTMNAYYRLSAGSSVASGAVGNNHFTMDGTDTATFTRNNLNGTGALDILINTSPQTLTINHNSEGSKTLTISYSINVNSTLGGVYYGVVTGNDTITLDPIPRMSLPNSFSAFALTATTIPITITRYSSAYTHDIALSIDGISVLTRTGILASTATAYTITISTGERTAMYNAIPNAMIGIVTLALTTKSGSTVIGTTQNYVLNDGATVPVATVPNFSTITVSEATTAVSALVLGTKFVQMMSTLNLAITSAVAGTGATISTYAITCEQKVINAVSGVSDALTCAGLTATAGVYTLVITGVVKDSRNQTVTKTVSISVYAYSKPKINSFYTKRATDVNGVENSLGTFCKYLMDVSVSSLLNGSSVQKNTLTYKLEYSLRGVNSFSVSKTATLAVNTIIKQTFECLGTYSVASSYDLRMTITDIFGATYASVATDTLNTGVVTMAWGDGFISIGKIPEYGGTYDLEVGSGGIRSDGAIVGNLTGNATTATTATNATSSSSSWGINVVDGRSTQTSTNFAKAFIISEFKTNAIDGLNDGGSFHQVVTLQQWADASGGTTHQLGLTDNGGLFSRVATIGGTWSAWRTINDSSNGIYEQGSNANGWYTKFTSGIMICSQTGTISANCSTIWNKWYISGGNYLWTYPSGFTKAVISFSGSLSGADLCMIVPEVMNTGLSCYYRMARGDTMATSSRDISVTAIGYWK